MKDERIETLCKYTGLCASEKPSCNDDLGQAGDYYCFLSKVVYQTSPCKEFYQRQPPTRQDIENG